MIQKSRFTETGAIAFEFERNPELSYNNRTIFVPQIAISFDTAPTAAGKVMIYYEDDEGKDLIWEENAREQKGDFILTEPTHSDCRRGEVSHRICKPQYSQRNCPRIMATIESFGE